MGKKVPKKKTEKSPEIIPDLKLVFAAKNDEQKLLLKTINENTVTFVRGWAGTGKTHIAMAYALQKLFQHKYAKIILVRPIVEGGGEKIGYLPGELMSKLKNYFIPMMAIAEQMVDPNTLKLLVHNNDSLSKIQVVPLAYMRGITVSNAVLIFDESQNSTIDQMRLLLTRVGDNSKFIICGDNEQSDIAPQKNGLDNAFNILSDVPDIGFVNMTQQSVVRHPLVQKIEQKYREQRAKQNK